MPKRVKLPNGGFGVFPDTMSNEQIEAVLQKQFPTQTETKPDQPGALKRFGQGMGIPTNKEELMAIQPTTTDKLLGPMALPVKAIPAYFKNLFEQGKASMKEAGEAGANIAEGGPVGANIGKATAAGSDLLLKGVLAPVGGQALATGGEDFAAGNYKGAAGDAAAALANYGLLRGGGKKAELSKVGELRQTAAETAPKAVEPAANVDTLAMREAMAKNGGQFKPGVAEEANKIKIRMQNEAKAAETEKMMNGGYRESAAEKARLGEGAGVAEEPPTTPLNRVGQLRETSRTQRFGRKVTGVETGLKEEVATAAEKHGKDLETHAAKSEEVKRGNLDKTLEAHAKHGEKVRKIEETNKQIHAENTAERAKVARRNQLSAHVDTHSLELGKKINSVENSVHKAANQKFNEVRSKIGDVEAPSENLVSSVKSIEQDILQGIPENVKEFRAIASLAPGGEEMGGLREEVMQGQEMQGSYDDLSPEHKATVDRIAESYGGGTVTEGKPVTWDKLQSLKSRLDARLRKGRGMNGDLKRGLYKLRDDVVEEMGGMAESKGAAKEWKGARDFWRQYKEDFHEPQGPSGSGSPVAQAREGVDPAFIRDPFLGKKSARALDILRKYPEHGGHEAATHAENLVKSHGEMKGLPEKFKEEPLKPMPEKADVDLTPRPKTPATPVVDATKVARDAIAQRAKNWGSFNARDIGILASSWIGGTLVDIFSGHGLELPLSVTAYEGGKYGASRLLTKPGVVEWLAQTPPEEMEVINKIPGADKVKIIQGVTEAAEKTAKTGKPVQLSPAARSFLGPANVARILVANSSQQGQIKNRRDAMSRLGQPVP